MSRREYDQSCSLAFALDSVGERWSLLIVRELMLGPLRFSDLARAVGGAPTDVLTKRLRDLEADGVVSRRELQAPAAATVYDLTELGHGLERPLLELARWGMELQKAEDVVDLAPSSLPNALRVILRPPTDVSFDLGLVTEGQSFALRARDGWIAGSRGGVGDPQLTLSGSPIEVLAAVVSGSAGVPGVEVEGDAALLDRLNEMVVVPDRLREEAQMMVESGALLIVAAEAAAEPGESNLAGLQP
ncbi:MAG TPA: helix-turn-helix domain-containing protein [Solirubrobacterales bacterium]|jgi:DNA-binding HxlR family transcriptional regulator|nr:helix-turn-helix domain-containing protein [Solirubrobacterales bacterium]